MSRRVILIEDDESNRLTLAAVLEDEGFTVREASSVEAARALAKTGEFDAVVLDRGLGRDDGLTLVPELRAANPAALLVVMSGSAPAAGEAHAVDAWVTKGDDLVPLVEALRER